MHLGEILVLLFAPYDEFAWDAGAGRLGKLCLAQYEYII